MKKLTYLLLSLPLLFLLSCEQDNRISGCSDPFAINFDPTVQVSDDDGTCVYPPTVNKALLLDITATWCGPCGDWGAPLFSASIEMNAGKLVPISVHPSTSDVMYTSIADEIANNYPDFTGYPTIVVNNQGNYYDEPTVTSAVNSFVTLEPAVSGVSIFEIDGDSAYITAQARFFEEISGDYHMAVYILEDGIDEPQEGMDDPDYLHDHVLRASANGSAFGERVLNGDSFIGQSETRKYTVSLDPSWNKEKLSAVTVIWRNVGGSYEFINASDGNLES